MNVDVQPITRLEQGEIIFLPHESFPLTAQEQPLLHPGCVDPKTKSIKYAFAQQKVWGMSDSKHSHIFKDMLQRYVTFAQSLVARLLPHYASSGALITGNSSFRPVEAENRVQSKRHDDRLLHVDSFPSRPMHGKRILRVFTNIHPGGQPRIWNSGEPFATVAARFLPRIPTPLPGSAAFMQWLRITKEKRSPYDHYMLHIHDAMKLDDEYQKTVPHARVSFPAGTSWIVFSDQVSHAALSGQHLLEQTFLLPPQAMENPSLSPLKVLEALKGRTLV